MTSIRHKMIAAGFLKQAEQNNWMTVLLRAASIPVVLLSLAVGAHPNLITALSLTCAGVACWLLYIDRPVLFFSLWALSALMDYADGTVARKAGKESYFGYLLDMLGDRVKLLLLLATWMAASDSGLSWLLGTSAVALLFVTEVISHLFLLQSPKKLAPTSDRSPWLYVSEIFLRFDMHTFFLYGLTLAASHNFGYAGTTWLNMVLLVYLGDSVRLRRSVEGGSLQLNPRFLNKLRR